ncbi:M14 family metallopeptidase [Prevotella sp. P2-180]|uniref:M14 family metallopeptidase n=1 Tax=Prevotella sp. P2-180 TaxID=2024224 RepID=UPI000B9689BA|nr:M14 family metallopeptidase [Prevotella sp. P2-180]OYP61126.1 succinylglutamate desuccinylase [Prevotella sp. P2-180]
MKREIIFKMESPYRGTFNIEGFRFGEGEKTVAIVGAMRGDEIQQQYICARLVAKLTELEQRDCIEEGKSILVIPSCNPFSMNVSKRFWAMDGTDINRMFPGYDKGETTQRIAAALFEHIKDFKYGLQLASFYMSGDFVPHVRMLTTGYEDVKTACLFGLPFVTKRKPLPFDTTLLNYNWQIWGAKAFSIYAGQTNHVEHETSNQTIDAILRFMKKISIVKYRPQKAGYESIVFDEAELVNVKAQRAGIFYRMANVGDRVNEGETLAQILDPYDSSVIQQVKSPVDGTVFFMHNRPLTLEYSILFRIQKND